MTCCRASLTPGVLSNLGVPESAKELILTTVVEQRKQYDDVVEALRKAQDNLGKAQDNLGKAQDNLGRAQEQAAELPALYKGKAASEIITSKLRREVMLSKGCLHARGLIGKS